MIHGPMSPDEFIAALRSIKPAKLRLGQFFYNTYLRDIDPTDKLHRKLLTFYYTQDEEYVISKIKQIMIDGVQYTPLVEIETDDKYKAALNVRFYCDVSDDVVSVRDYLFMLLDKLWDEKESFSGKRPFGNSDWEYDLFSPLVHEGFISGEVNACGDIVWLDYQEACQFVSKLIKVAIYGDKE